MGMIYMAHRYQDLYGHKVERSPRDYPYSYDEFVLWKSPMFNPRLEDFQALYSDRMWEWNPENFTTASSICFSSSHGGQSFSNRTPDRIEKFINYYFTMDDVTEMYRLKALLEGCNYSNGYPYWVFIVVPGKMREVIESGSEQRVHTFWEQSL